MRVDEIARFLNASFTGDGSREIRGVAALDAAGPDHLTFAEGARALSRASSSGSGCILIPLGTELEGRTTIAVPHPKLAFIRAASILAPGVAPPSGIHATAVVSPEARLGPEVSVGSGAVIERGARVGARTRLAAGVFLGEEAEVGEDSVLHPRVTVYPRARIGNRVILHAGVVVGSDGFGYVFAEGRHHKFPQLGGVIIEDEVEIGSNSTVDRGSLGTTVIGEGTKIDNLVQIAHNVRIGRHCVIAAQTGISGSVEIGDFVVMGGQVGIGERVRIEDGVRIGGQGGILTGKIVRKGATLWGTPARPLEVFKRQYAYLNRLPDLARRVRELEKQMLNDE
jgi:UDP-3-O-[3-hydroxymyristoyl] glucosamine N-acyltransferase